jgi:hypothetical protein
LLDTPTLGRDPLEDNSPWMKKSVKICFSVIWSEVPVVLTGSQSVRLRCFQDHWWWLGLETQLGSRKHLLAYRWSGSFYQGIWLKNATTSVINCILWWAICVDMCPGVLWVLLVIIISRVLFELLWPGFSSARGQGHLIRSLVWGICLTIWWSYKVFAQIWIALDDALIILLQDPGGVVDAFTFQPVQRFFLELVENESSAFSTSRPVWEFCNCISFMGAELLLFSPCL